MDGVLTVSGVCTPQCQTPPPGSPRPPCTSCLGFGNGQGPLARTARIASPSSPPQTPTPRAGPHRTRARAPPCANAVVHLAASPACPPPPPPPPSMPSAEPPTPALSQWWPIPRHPLSPPSHALVPRPLPQVWQPAPWRPPYRGFGDAAGPERVCGVCEWVREGESVGPQGDGLRRGRHFSGLLLALFFPVCFHATACRGASLMQEPSGLLAPFLRVFLSLFLGGVRRAAP